MKYGQEGGYGSVPKRKRGWIVVVVMLVLVALGVGGFYCYKQFFAKNAMEVLMYSVFDYLEASIESSDYDSVTYDFEVQMNLQSSDAKDNEILAIFNKLDFSGSYGIDFDQSIMSVDFRSNYDDKDLFDFSVYMEYGRGYIYLDGLYDKYIDTSIDNYSEMFERNIDDYKYLIVGIRNAMESSLKDEYYIIENVSIDGKKLEKTTLDLTGDNYQEWNKNFTNLLLTDSNFMDSYAKVFDIDLEEAKKELEDTLEEDKDYEGEQFVLYMKGLEFVKFELISEDSRVVVSASDKNKYNYQLFEAGVEYGSGSVEMASKDNDSMKVICYDNEEEMGIELIFKISTKKNSRVDRKDVSNSISSDNISDEDIAAIYSKLMENEGIGKIIEEISTLFGYEDNEENSFIVASQRIRYTFFVYIFLYRLNYLVNISNI